MADSFSAMGSALYAKIAPLNGSAIYDIVASATVTPPYEVFQRVDGADWYTFNTSGEELLYMVKSISDRYWPHTAYARYGTVHAAIQDATLTVPGFSQLRFRRVNTIGPYQDNEKFWHVGGVYRCEIVPT